MSRAAVSEGLGRQREEPQEGAGSMYGRSFADPDGHVFEIMWMDPAGIASCKMPQIATA